MVSMLRVSLHWRGVAGPTGWQISSLQNPSQIWSQPAGKERGQGYGSESLPLGSQQNLLKGVCHWTSGT